MSRVTFLFPGQGSQSPGMRARLGHLSEAQRVLFEQADSLLGVELCRLIDEGPAEELTRTSNAQPALLVTDLAYAMGLEALGHEAEVVLGHSLGEYAALVWAGVLTFPDALRLVRRRGELMEQACEQTPGGMVAVLRAPLAALQELVAGCTAQGVVEITNYNSPDQVVLSGEHAALAEAVARIQAAGLGRVMPLNVAAPFHSSLMAPVARAFAPELAGVPFAAPRRIFIDNVSGRPEAEPERIRAKLVQQIERPVAWEQSLRSALELGCAPFYEAGPGSVLCGLLRRIDRRAPSCGAEAVLGAV